MLIHIHVFSSVSLSNIFGLIALVAPGIALLAFIYVFAAYALVDGGIAVITAIQERELLYRWDGSCLRES